MAALQCKPSPCNWDSSVELPGLNTLLDGGTSTFLEASGVYGNYLDEVWTLDDRSAGTGGTVAQLNDGTGGQRKFYHNNSLFHVYGITDEVAGLVEAYQYDAYGKQTIITDGNDGDAIVNFNANDVRTVGGNSTVNNPYMYTGQRFDPETGLMYFKNRYMSTDLGRFVSRDPIGYGGLSEGLYEYVSSRVTFALDCYGLFDLPPDPCCTCHSWCQIYVKHGPWGSQRLPDGSTDGYYGHQWIEAFDSLSPGNLLSRGFPYSKAGAQDLHSRLRDATTTWQAKMRNCCGYSKAACSWWIFGGTDPDACGTMKAGKYAGIKCCSATCFQAIDCIKAKMVQWSNVTWNLWKANCRMWVDEALQDCCLCTVGSGRRYEYKTIAGDHTIKDATYPPAQSPPDMKKTK